MSKTRKIIIVIVIILLALKCNSTSVFTNGTYSPIVLLLCYTFISFNYMNQINKMSLSRYASLKNLYISMCKNQSVSIFKYLVCFVLIGVSSELMGIFWGNHICVSFEARIKFFILSYINLFILSYLQLVMRILYGKWVALEVACVCIFVSTAQLLLHYYKISPFIFMTAYLRGHTILSRSTLIGYSICFVTVSILSILSLRKDRAI